MKYAVVYSSVTGNTARLAERIGRMLPPQQLCYFGPPDEKALQAQTLLVGSWTDKGGCCPQIAAFMGRLAGKRVFVFGTAGFGGSPQYFDQVGRRMARNLPAGCTLLGWHLCQGRMPAAVRARYEALARTDPEKAKPMLDNFDRALSHPDEADLKDLEQAVRAALKDAGGQGTQQA